MKTVIFLAIAVAACRANVGQFKSAMQANQAVEKVRWKETKPYKQVTDTFKTMFDLLHLAGLADMSNEAKRAVEGATVSGRPGLPGGFDRGTNDRPAAARPRILEKFNVFDKLKNEREARSFINRNSGGGAGGGGGSFRVSSVGGATKDPSVVVEEASKRVPKVNDLRVRKAYRCLTQDERRRYHAAVNALKNTPVGSTNAYDVFAILHNQVVAPAAHFGPAFLPWHRQFLWMYEEALRQMDPTVTLPYWDNSADEDLPNPLESAIWRDSHLGTANGPVTRGPLANWQTPAGDTLRRNVSGNTEFLYNDEIIDVILEPNNFNNFWEFAEMAHGGPHVYVSGHMNNLDTAAMDPLFFMHHAYVDCLWEEWREENQYPTNTETDYPADAVLEVNQRRGSRMLPFRVNNEYGLNRVYTKLYYKCHPRNDCPNKKCGCDRYSRDCEEGRGGAIDGFIDSIQPAWLRDIFLRNAHGQQASC